MRMPSVSHYDSYTLNSICTHPGLIPFPSGGRGKSLPVEANSSLWALYPISFHLLRNHTSICWAFFPQTSTYSSLLAPSSIFTPDPCVFYLKKPFVDSSTSSSSFHSLPLCFTTCSPSRPSISRAVFIYCLLLIPQFIPLSFHPYSFAERLLLRLPGITMLLK